MDELPGLFCHDVDAVDAVEEGQMGGPTRAALCYQTEFFLPEGIYLLSFSAALVAPVLYKCDLCFFLSGVYLELKRINRFVKKFYFHAFVG